MLKKKKEKKKRSNIGSCPQVPVASNMLMQFQTSDISLPYTPKPGF